MSRKLRTWSSHGMGWKYVVVKTLRANFSPNPMPAKSTPMDAVPPRVGS